MTFSEWWETKFEDSQFALTVDDMDKAFEAGYNACLDGLINGSDHSEWIEVHKETLEELKK